MNKQYAEQGIVIRCADAELMGIYHPAATTDAVSFGLVIVVAGGPQYRVGAHRQFVVMARILARAGVPVLRFDHRGVGDSDGEFRGFLDMDADIGAAIDTLQVTVPTIKRVYLWGECESASAIAFYGHQDPRVVGLYMVNPWVRTETGQAKAILRHYYWMRLTNPAFWRKLRSGQFSLTESLQSMWGLAKTALLDRRRSDSAAGDNLDAAALANLALPERLPRSLQQFTGAVVVLTSGHDFIAREFTDSVNASSLWQPLKSNQSLAFEEIADADHTFTKPEWRTDLYDRTVRWTLNVEQTYRNR